MPTLLRKQKEGERLAVPEQRVEQEAIREQALEQPSAPVEVVSSVTPIVVTPSTVALVPVAVPVKKSEEIQRVEEILSDGLREIFQSLTPAQQQVFKQEGERVAERIVKAMGKTHSFAERAWKWIRKWLGSLPNLSRAFVVQESKIKTDKLLALLEKQHS